MGRISACMHSVAVVANSSVTAALNQTVATSSGASTALTAVQSATGEVAALQSGLCGANMSRSGI